MDAVLGGTTIFTGVEKHTRGFCAPCTSIEESAGFEAWGVPPNLCLEFVGFCGARNESC